jgi:spore coat polysaccharide biosynthesis protein SpsF (cytidylyltransferase family)
MKAAIVYARADSTRLPRKAFRRFGNNTLLEHVILRANHLSVEAVVLATSDRPVDDAIAKLGTSLQGKSEKKILIHRSSFDDCVQRTKNAIVEHDITRFCRINGDSPFFPISLTNKYITNKSYKFYNNIRNRSYPYGLSVEILDSNFYFEKSLNVPEHLIEHTTAHLYADTQYQDEYLITDLISPLHICDETTRYVIDTPQDYTFWISLITKYELTIKSELFL